MLELIIQHVPEIADLLTLQLLFAGMGSKDGSICEISGQQSSGHSRRGGVLSQQHPQSQWRQFVCHLSCLFMYRLITHV